PSLWLPMMRPETSIPAARAPLPLLPSELAWHESDDAGENPVLHGLSQKPSAWIGTGVLASAGYVLLNTRTGFWLLSLLTAKPMWKQFDPLEILYAWEDEGEEHTEEE